MMLQVFAYAIAVAAVLSVVGICAERFARLHRLPRRTAWAAAMLLSVLLPAGMILLARPAEIRNVTVPVADLEVPYINPDPAIVLESPAAQLPSQTLPSVQSVRMVPGAPSTGIGLRFARNLPRPTDRMLITTWMATSSVLALYLFGANLLLRRRMKGWRSATVQDHQVLVSEVTGPALLGAFSPRIVVPRWLLLQPHGTQALILQHEQQHVQARDALLIMAGLVAIVAVPWNLPLWWQWRRLRQAIEMDCDARVLGAGAEANAYAAVLLAVTQRSRMIPAGALAMSEPVHAVERRIANLLPDAIRFARLQGIAVLLLAAAGAGAALALDAPALPGRAAAMTPLAAPQGVNAPASAVLSASRAAVITAAQSTIMAAAAPASRAEGPAPVVQTKALAHLATEPASFMVRILSPVAEPSLLSIRLTGDRAPPRPSGGVDAAARARLEEYYAILVEKLTAVPGLKLITEATPGVSVVSCEISIRLGADWKGVVIEATSVPNSSGPKVRATTRDASLFINTLSAESRDSIPVDDPERDMERFVERLRLELFPPNRALLDQKMSELRDPQLQPGLRVQAVRQLMTVDSLYDSSGTRLDSFSGRLMTYPPDPALLGAATELAITDKNPALRLALWSSLITDPLNPIDPAVLVAPAGRALASETDPRVQLMLVNILNLSAGNPLARAALESAASRSVDIDHPELVRMAARRVLDGGAGWNDYFVERLKDPQVPDTERVELINYALSISSSGRWGSRGARMKLDETVERTLGSLLKSPVSTEVVAAAARLLGDRLLPRSADKRGSPVAYEELLDFLRAGTGKHEADPKVRGSVVTQLLIDLRLHPEARPVFEEIVARDRDPVLRERTRQALERTPQ